MIVEKYKNLLILNKLIITAKIKNQQNMRDRPKVVKINY